MASKRTTKTIDVTISKRGQDVLFVELLELAGAQSAREHRLRVKIESDSYRDQCWARIERWNGETWHEIWSIDSGAMKTERGLAYASVPASAGDFKDDRDLLVQRAIEVLL